jgi:hypothetical protein
VSWLQKQWSAFTGIPLQRASSSSPVIRRTSSTLPLEELSVDERQNLREHYFEQSVQVAIAKMMVIKKQESHTLLLEAGKLAHFGVDKVRVRNHFTILSKVKNFGLLTHFFLQ